MKISLLLSFCILFKLTCVAQKYNIHQGDTINRTDAKGAKQGLWKKYYKNDTLFSEGVYRNNIHTGDFHTYFEDGKPQSVLSFRGLTEISSAKLFNAEGAVIATGKYTGHEKDSTWLYYDDQGKKNSEEFYINGKKNGIWKVFYPSRQISQLITYKNDKKTGAHKEFFEDGKLKIDGVMKDNDFDGPVKVYHSTGKVWQQGIYKNGVREGVWKINNPDGSPDHEEIYKAGKILNPPAEEK